MLILSDTFSRSTMNSAKKTNIQDTLQTFHEFGFWSRVEGTKSRVEGNMSRVEGNMSRVLKNEYKIIKIKKNKNHTAKELYQSRQYSLDALTCLIYTS